MTQIQAAGVVFVDSAFDGYKECVDCGGLVAEEGNSYGVDPEAHTCSV